MVDARPLIGVSAWIERARWDAFEDELTFVEASFVRLLGAVGADVVLIPPQARVPDRLLEVLEGVVLPGGHDVHPGRYGCSAPAPAKPEVDARDELELALARHALAAGLPILGVCRGCQVLNVAAGGSLVHEVTERYAGIVHTHYAPGAQDFSFASHTVTADPDTPVGRALGPAFDVMSSHHQAVDELGDGMRPAAWSGDGLVEAIFADGHPFAIGVQWHPEAADELKLFAALVAAARARRAERSLSGGGASPA